MAGQPSDVLLERPGPGAKQGWCFPLPAVLTIVPIKCRRSGRVRAVVPCQASCLLVAEGRAPSGGAEGVCPHIRGRAVRTFSARYKLVVSHLFFFYYYFFLPLFSLCSIKPLCGFPSRPDVLVSPQQLQLRLVERLKLTNLASSGWFLEHSAVSQSGKEYNRVAERIAQGQALLPLDLS